MLVTKIIGCTVLLSVSIFASGQQNAPKLAFVQGDTLTVSIKQESTVAQEVMGRNIDFKSNSTIEKQYKVTNVTEDNNTLGHQLKRISFKADGMGQGFNFDSDNKKDLDGQLGKPIKEMMGKTYNVIVDGTGKALMSIPQTFDKKSNDQAGNIVTSMIPGLQDVANPPAKGSSSFFKVLPDTVLVKGYSWTTSATTPTEISATVHTIQDITDSVIVVEFRTAAESIVTSQMMNMDATTKISTITTGKTYVDKFSGIIKSQSSVAEGKGTVEAMNSLMPMTIKTTTELTVGRSVQH
jgi:hypothetical protein